MRAALAIFSLVCLKCGCKKLLAQLASLSKEHEGVAAVGCQGSRLLASRLFPRALRLGGASCHVQFLCSSAALVAMLGGILSRKSQVFSDLTDVYRLLIGCEISDPANLEGWGQSGLRPACFSL